MVMPSHSGTAAKRRKSPSKSPTRPGKHGGRLLTGNPGNKGGTGRPPDAIRATCRDSFDTRIATLEQIADDTNADPALRIRAIEALAKYGLGTTTDNTHRISRADLEKLTDAELESLASQ